MGNCSAGGSYGQAFVDTETNGTWGSAKEVPGFNTLNKGYALLTSLSCGAVAHCSAGGLYSDRSDAHQAWVVNQT